MHALDVGFGVVRARGPGCGESGGVLSVIEIYQ
jgi:hypothetical protein